MVLVTLESVKIVGMYQRCKKQKLPSDNIYRITHEKDNSHVQDNKTDDQTDVIVHTL
jgi:hypothetical protein